MDVAVVILEDRAIRVKLVVMDPVLLRGIEIPELADPVIHALGLAGDNLSHEVVEIGAQTYDHIASSVQKIRIRRSTM
ncbi:hypothetical protein [Halorubrum halophilum]|uniref:hypothetical protein n=1 Tax=Halorubrum halophilum TaxID=413816 RepID=UPI0012AC5A38|nr:hypothetical protein [Halorubrum halophilum]